MKLQTAWGDEDTIYNLNIDGTHTGSEGNTEENNNEVKRGQETMPESGEDREGGHNKQVERMERCARLHVVSGALVGCREREDTGRTWTVGVHEKHTVEEGCRDRSPTYAGGRRESRRTRHERERVQRCVILRVGSRALSCPSGRRLSPSGRIQPRPLHFLLSASHAGVC